LKSGRQDVAEEAVHLSVQLAQSQERLTPSRQVSNLEQFVGPLTFDFLLYFVTFHTDAMTVPPVGAIAEAERTPQCEVKSVFLLCKVIIQTRDAEVTAAVLRLFEANIMRRVDNMSGALMVPVLNRHGRMMVGFFVSTFLENGVTGYEALFAKGNTPNVLKVAQFLGHFKADHDNREGLLWSLYGGLPRSSMATF
jgi:hypothetical protein